MLKCVSVRSLSILKYLVVYFINSSSLIQSFIIMFVAPSLQLCVKVMLQRRGR